MCNEFLYQLLLRLIYAALQLCLQLFTPNMEMILYSRDFSEDYHGKFNMVQAAFLLLQSAQDDATVHKLHRRLSQQLKPEVFNYRSTFYCTSAVSLYLFISCSNHLQ